MFFLKPGKWRTGNGSTIVRTKWHKCTRSWKDKPAQRSRSIRHARLAPSARVRFRCSRCARFALAAEFSDADAELLVGDCVAAAEIGKLRAQRSAASVRVTWHHP